MFFYCHCMFIVVADEQDEHRLIEEISKVCFILCYCYMYNVVKVLPFRSTVCKRQITFCFMYINWPF